MTTPKEAPYRHERLAPGSLYEAGTVKLHFDLGGDREVQRTLRERLIQNGATPEEWFVVQQHSSSSGKRIAAEHISHVIVFPTGMKEELARHGRTTFRLADDFDVEPCSAKLLHVVGFCDAAGNVHTADRADPAEWIDERIG